MKVEVVDTNVVLAANGQHAELSRECVADCALRLQRIMKEGKLAIDDYFRILNEYQNKTKPKQGSRPGDAFVKWALNNRANRKWVDLVALREHETRGFESFPDDPSLTDFDSDDRKLIAVASAHAEKPAVLQAADSKWFTWKDGLSDCGIQVEFLCPKDIARFHERKFGERRS